jgi:hypothetical protein
MAMQLETWYSSCNHVRTQQRHVGLCELQKDQAAHVHVVLHAITADQGFLKKYIGQDATQAFRSCSGSFGRFRSDFSETRHLS